MELYLRQIREQKEMTIRELSKGACMAKSYIQKLEDPNENSNPSICIVCRLAKALNIPVGELFGCD